MQSAKSIRTS
ncbi:unnamed protein product, partial [Rotaria sp. Silwood2]